MQQSIESILTAVDAYLRSKTNALVSFTVTTSTLASTKISNVPFFHTVINGEIVFNWVFLFQCLGAVFLVMQMMHMCYRFYKFIKGE